ncbi:NAD(P)H-hydrate dehydratase [Albidovulum sediminis]|uniref:Bifunctional NAD(P)H-hydrate repair enzyme n=1 Tax=Albidovulum sediminis TaxID=3066345 RepID=A0ABT2NJZ7_9RHOB|nr:NAD(P)H-hydrate dehydratase [Defluviimonas sediminis]MCT8329252.1 NAD(P)H-hydrate dehydratase [Defluviimonas sediminis]
MTELLTAAQMRAIEQAAIASGEVTGLELMERAGRGVVEAIFEEWPELAKTSHRAVVLCGPGNNGGDGFVVARLLKEWGWEVEVFLYGDPEKMPPDARVNYERWLGMGEVVGTDLNTEFLPPPIHPCGHHLVVDALFGIGLSRPLAWPNMLDFFGTLDDPGLVGNIRRVSVDVPSGICADSGRLLGKAAFPADLTVTFHRTKIGMMLALGPEACGGLVVKDIGLSDDAGNRDEARARPAGGAFAPAPGGRVGREPGLAPRQETVFVTSVKAARIAATRPNAHKYSHGHALILSGGAGRGGAARLAARGAIRIGAGVVTVGCPPEALAENAARLDAVMLKPVADADELAQVLEDKRINALCLGPGLGTGEREVELVATALAWHLAEGLPLIDATEAQVAAFLKKNGHRPSIVLDADALTILAGRPDLFAALHDRCVLTPHGGEFARLFPDIAEKLAAPAMKGPAYSKVDATREAAARAGCVVLFKGPDTVIADPSGRCSINSAHYDRAAPWLATAGSGDVLAGFIAGLLARGFAPMQAAETAAWLHVECARTFGPGLIAEDLPEQLPAVFRTLGL